MSHRASASNNQSQEETELDIKYVIQDLATNNDRFNLSVTRVDNDTAIFVVSVRDEDYERAT